MEHPHQQCRDRHVRVCRDRHCPPWALETGAPSEPVTSPHSQLRRFPLSFLLLQPRLESWGISYGGRGSSTLCPHTRLPRCVHAVGHAQETPCPGREVSKDHPWITVLLRSLMLFPLSECTLLRQLKMTLDIHGEGKSWSLHIYGVRLEPQQVAGE